jgi:D-glycero-alpha-D-manno-heptose 1-phosphate guanylyltransferase
LREALPNLPKPMAPVAGRPFLEYLLDYWIGQGITRFILSVGYKQDTIRAHFADAYRGVPVAYAVESSPRGTGGGLLLACQQLSSMKTFLTMNGDTFFEVRLGSFLSLHKSCQADMTIALHPSDNSQRYLGIELDTSQRLLGFRGSATSGVPYVNGGAYLIEPRVLASYDLAKSPISLENDILPDLLRRKALLYGFPSDTAFLDIGVPSDFSRASSILLKGLPIPDCGAPS